jgi:hypothetical protein
MSSPDNSIALASLEFLPYIDADGELPLQLQNLVGIYAIFDRSQILQFVGYSRDIYLSLKQHLVRQPDRCYWLKVATIERPNRTWLETVKSAWIEENGSIPNGNGEAEAGWVEPIDTSNAMSDDELNNMENLDELGQIKLRKQVARRVEETIVKQLQERGITTEIRFNPKLKERGLLDLK